MSEPATNGNDANDAPGPIQIVDEGGLRSVVTELKSTEQQIGEHTIRALQQDGSVAVLTAVVLGPDGRQRIVSTALDTGMMHQIQSLLHDAVQEREEDVPCVGFHCFVRPRGDDTKLVAGEDEDDTDAST